MPTVNVPRERVEVGTLPDACLVCGRPGCELMYADARPPHLSASATLAVLFSPTPDVGTVHFLPFWLSVLTPGSGRGGLPFCRRHRHYWRRRARVVVCGSAGVACGFLTFLACLGVETVLGRDPDAGVTGQFAVAWAFWLIWYLPTFIFIQLRSTRVIDGSGDWLVVAGAHRRFIAALRAAEDAEGE